MGLASRTMADQHAISHTLDLRDSLRRTAIRPQHPPATFSQVAAATPDELINSAA